MRILVIEDESDLATAIRDALDAASFAVDLAVDGEDGLHWALGVDYDAIVLDLMLPRLDGWSVLERVREIKQTPVLILTARDALADRVRGLDSGADDYLTKPFEIEELQARVRALVRRAAGRGSAIIEVGEVRIDTAARTLTRGGEEVTLAAKEFALLELLVSRRGSVVTRTTIYEHLWSDDDDTRSNVVDVYVSFIRSKIGRDFIRTRRGVGYIVE